MAISMKIRAYVQSVTNKTKHYHLDSVEKSSSVKWVEISEKSDGVYLFYFNSTGECVSDTWHESVNDAKEQALFEFEINKDSWIAIGGGEG